MNRALLTVPLLLVAACSASTPPAAVESAAAPSPVLDSPSAEPSSPEPSPSTAPSPSKTAVAVRALDGDVDGDGKPDRIRVSGSTLTVTLTSNGKAISTSVDSDLETHEPAAAAGSVDVDRDGRAEVFVRVGQGASTTTLRPFGYDGRALAPVQTNGAPLLLVVGGSITHGDGFTCTDTGRLVVRSAESNDGSAFTVTTTTYRLSAGAAIRLARTVTHATGMDDPKVAAAYRVDCGSVGEGD